MKVRELMTSSPTFCAPHDRLDLAAARLGESDCGLLPVVEHDTLVGVVSDRDICLAVPRWRSQPDLEVRDVLSRPVYVCAPNSSIDQVLKQMARHQVRRLPVVDRGVLVGMLSLNDVILECQPTGSPQSAAIDEQTLLRTLRAICCHRDALAPA